MLKRRPYDGPSSALISLRLPRDIVNSLDKLASKKGWTRSQLINHIIEGEMKKRREVEGKLAKAS